MEKKQSQKQIDDCLSKGLFLIEEEFKNNSSYEQDESFINCIE